MRRIWIAWLVVVSLVWIFRSGVLAENAEAPAEPIQPAEQRPPAPSIVCDQPVYNFGEMANTQDVEHAFVIRNEGTATLEIRNVRASCGCTATEISNKMIPPGESSTVKAKLNLRGRQGRQYKTIFVDSNDPKTPVLTLAFEGHAQPAFKVQPRQIFFGRIGAQATVTAVVEIASASGQEIHIKRVDSGHPMLSAVVVGEPPHLEVEIKTVPPLAKGPFQSRVVVETDHPTDPITEIFVTGFVVGDVTYAPTEIVLREAPDQPAVRYILLRSETEQPFQILSVSTPQPEMESVVQPTAPSAYRIEIRNIRATSELNGQTVRIQTTLPETKEIVVPFRVMPANP